MVGQSFFAALGFMRAADQKTVPSHSRAPVILEPSQYGLMPKDGDQWNTAQHITTRATPAV